MLQATNAETASLNRLLPDLTRLERLVADEEAAVRASLDRLLPDLTRLERLVADEEAAASRNAMLALRNFAVDNDDLAQLEELLAEAKPEMPQLDFLDVLGISESEVAHSNFLGWLLDPGRDHRTGDHFLKDFLRETATHAENLGIAVASPDEIDAIDWSASSVRREEYYIDILIVNPASQFLCAIENKIWAPEGDRQLSRYRQVLENAYPDYIRHYVFLTPDGRQSQEKTEREFWVPLGYATILKRVERTIADQGDFISEEARAALQFYATALRRHIVPESTEIQRLARSIYLEHSEAITLIDQYKPNIVEETKRIVRQAIAQQPGWIEELESSWILRFSSENWGKFDSFRIGTGWGNPSPVLLFEIKFREEPPYLVLDLDFTLGPASNESIRSKIHTAVSQNGDVFNHAGQPLTRRYRILDRKSSVMEIADFQDERQLGDKIKAWMADFAQNEFPRMDEIIVQAFREYEAGE